MDEQRNPTTILANEFVRSNYRLLVFRIGTSDNLESNSLTDYKGIQKQLRVPFLIWQLLSLVFTALCAAALVFAMTACAASTGNLSARPQPGADQRVVNGHDEAIDLYERASSNLSPSMRYST